MNLVAKEFVACQINKPPGVLVVSPFAGAGETMHEALICNPYEIEDAAEVLHRCVKFLALSCFNLLSLFPWWKISVTNFIHTSWKEMAVVWIS